jgi:hypothetical protein
MDSIKDLIEYEAKPVATPKPILTPIPVATPTIKPIPTPEKSGFLGIF